MLENVVRVRFCGSFLLNEVDTYVKQQDIEPKQMRKAFLNL